MYPVEISSDLTIWCATPELAVQLGDTLVGLEDDLSWLTQEIENWKVHDELLEWRI